MISRTIIGKEIARQCGLRQSDGQQAVDIVFEMIAAALARGEDVRVNGFGRFSVRRRAACEGHNPRTRAKIAIAASVGVTFRSARTLKVSLNPPAPVRKVGGDRNSPMTQRKLA